MKNPSSWMLYILLICLPLGAIAQLVPATHVFKDSIEYSFDTNVMLSHVKTLSDDSFEGRRTGTKGAEMARTYIKTQLKRFKTEPLTEGFEQSFTFQSKSGSYDGINILGKITGAVHPETYIVLSAHYDHEGIKDGVIYNGADDDASGVAALLALADYYQTNPPKHSVILAFFDAEELGLQGSKFYVKNAVVPLKSILFNINLDMISRNTNDEIYAVGVNSHTLFTSVLEDHMSKNNIKILLGHDGTDGKQDWTSASDHGSFYDKGVPFLYFGVEDHEDYHQPTDDYERIDPTFLTNVVESIIGIFEQLDQ